MVNKINKIAVEGNALEKITASDRTLGIMSGIIFRYN